MRYCSIVILSSLALWYASKSQGMPKPSIQHFGQLPPQTDFFLNTVIGPFLPTTLSSTDIEAQMDAAISRHPQEASYLGFASAQTAPWRQSLRSYVAEANQQNVLTPFGRLAAQRVLNQAAHYNATIIDFIAKKLQQNPNAFALGNTFPEERILFIVGNYRSGTSILHRLLASDPRAIYLPQWALKAGIDVKNAGEGMAFADLMDSYSRWDKFRWIAPEVAHNSYLDHPMAPHLAEEDGLFWATNSFTLPGLLVQELTRLQPRCSKSAAFYEGTDSHEIFIKKTLPWYIKAWLHHESPLWSQIPLPKPGDKRFLVLKAPFYGARVDLLRQAFPKSIIISTNRPVRRGIKSIFLLWLQATSIFVNPSKVSPSDVTTNILDHYEMVAKGLAKAQSKHWIDINIKHKDIVQDPIDVIEKQIYGPIGLIALPQAREAMQKLRQQMQESLGRNKDINFLDFGIDLDREIDQRKGFAAYEEAFREFI